MKDNVLDKMTFEEAKKYLEPSTVSRLSKGLKDDSIVYYTTDEGFSHYLLDETETRIATFANYPSPINFFRVKNEQEERELQTHSLRYTIDDPFVTIDGKLYFRRKYNDFIKRFSDLYPKASWSEEKERYRYPKDKDGYFNVHLFSFRYQSYLLVLRN